MIYFVLITRAKLREKNLRIKKTRMIQRIRHFIVMSMQLNEILCKCQYDLSATPFDIWNVLLSFPYNITIKEVYNKYAANLYLFSTWNITSSARYECQSKIPGVKFEQQY